MLLTVGESGGRWLVAAVADNAVCVWAVDDGPGSELLLRTDSRMNLGTAVVAGGGQVLVGLGGMDEMHRWRLPTGDLLRGGDALEFPLWWADSSAVSVEHPEVSVVVTGVGDCCLWAWDPETGEQVGDRWRGHQGQIRTVAAAVLADGTPLVFSGALDGVVRRWDARTGRGYGPPLRAGEGDPVELATARLPDGRTALCVATTEGRVYRLDAASGQPLAGPVGLNRSESLAGSPFLPSRLACLPTAEGPIMLTTVDNRTVDVRDLAGGLVLNGVDTGNSMAAMAAAVLADGTPVILAADEGGYVRRFHALTGVRLGAPMKPFPRPVHHVWAVPGPGGGVVLAAVLEGGLCRFDATTGEPIDDPADPMPAWGFCHALATDQARRPVLVVAGSGVYRVDPVTGTVLEPGPRMEDIDGMYDIAAVPLPDGRVLLATAGDDGLVHRRDAVTDDIIGPPLRGHPGIVRAVTATTTADGDPMIVSVSENGDVRRWNAVTGDPIGEPLRAVGYDNGDLDVLRHDDGRQVLICVAITGTLHQWDPVTGRPTGPTVTLDGDYARLVAAYATTNQVPTAVLAVLDDNYDVMRIERWRLDTAEKVDDLPDTVRTVFHHAGRTRMVLANDDGTLTVAALPGFG